MSPINVVVRSGFSLGLQTDSGTACVKMRSVESPQELGCSDVNSNGAFLLIALEIFEILDSYGAIYSKRADRRALANKCSLNS